MTDMDERITFTQINGAGEEVEFEVLFTFEDRLTGKNYMLYTDYSLDDNGGAKVYAATFDPEDPDAPLMPVEIDAEWEMIAAVVQEIQDRPVGE